MEIAHRVYGCLQAGTREWWPSLTVEPFSGPVSWRELVSVTYFVNKQNLTSLTRNMLGSEMH